MSNYNQELLNEGRACLINSLLAYGDGFGVLAPDEITEDLMETINEGISTVEALMPVLIAMWEMRNKVSGDEVTFVEFLMEVAEKYGAGPDHGLFN